MTPRSVSVRDRGLALLSQINRWLIAGAVAFAGFISLVAAHAFHGHTIGASSAGAQSQPASAPGLQQPSQAPSSASSSPAPVVSGGS